MFTEQELAVICKLLRTDVVKNEMGAANWNLTFDEEGVLWQAIEKAERKR